MCHFKTPSSSSIGDEMVEKCYCCNENAVSREHIPPRCIFPNPKPSNMITVPSCDKHNLEKSKDDEYFRWFIVTTCAEKSPIAYKLLKEKVIRGLRRKPKLLNKIMSNSIKNIDIYSKGGIWLERRPGFKYNKNRISRIIKLLCKGLYYYHFHKQIINIHKFALEFNPDLEKNAIDEITNLKFYNIGKGDVFSYRYYRKNIYGKDACLWFLFFYDSFLVNCLIC